MDGRLLVMRRSDVSRMAVAFEKCAGCARGPLDDPEEYRRFKYAAGRNADALRRIDEESRKRARAMVPENPQYQEYLQKRHALALAHCLRDPQTNEPMYLHGGQDGRDEEFRFSSESEQIVNKGLDALQVEFRAAIKTRNKAAAEIDALADEKIYVLVYMVRWETVPELISGAYMAAVAPMLANLPEGDLAVGPEITGPPLDVSTPPTRVPWWRRWRVKRGAAYNPPPELLGDGILQPPPLPAEPDPRERSILEPSAGLPPAPLVPLDESGRLIQSAHDAANKPA